MKMPVVNLTPFERARLKLIKYLAYVIGFNALLAIIWLIASGGKIDIQTLLTIVGGQAVLAGLLAFDKYASAHLDAPLVIALNAATKQVAAELHVDAATLTIPDLPVDLTTDPTQQTTAQGPVLSGITDSVGGADTLPRVPVVTTKVLQ